MVLVLKCGIFWQRRREECERKARRGEMDPRLEFAFQFLIDATGLPRHEIMDHVFEGNMVNFQNYLEEKIKFSRDYFNCIMFFPIHL